MIHLFSWPTPNGIKVQIMLEEIGLLYKVTGIDITKGDQFKPSFLKISPNNKMPAIIDEKGPGGRPLSVFESGAILMYLAEKTGKLLPKRTREKMEVIQWLMFQMGTVGPMLGQSNFFRKYCPVKVPYALKRYTNEAARWARIGNNSGTNSSAPPPDQDCICALSRPLIAGRSRPAGALNIRINWAEPATKAFCQ